MAKDQSFPTNDCLTLHKCASWIKNIALWVRPSQTSWFFSIQFLKLRNKTIRQKRKKQVCSRCTKIHYHLSPAFSRIPRRYMDPTTTNMFLSLHITSPEEMMQLFQKGNLRTIHLHKKKTQELTNHKIWIFNKVRINFLLKFLNQPTFHCFWSFFFPFNFLPQIQYPNIPQRSNSGLSTPYGS